MRLNKILGWGVLLLLIMTFSLGLSMTILGRTQHFEAGIVAAVVTGLYLILYTGFLRQERKKGEW